MGGLGIRSLIRDAMANHQLENRTVRLDDVTVTFVSTRCVLRS